MRFFFPFCISLSVDGVIVQVLFRKQFLEDTVSEKASGTSGSYSVSVISSRMFPEPWVQETLLFLSIIFFISLLLVPVLLPFYFSSLLLTSFGFALLFLSIHVLF